jgi:hypothetical protein
MSTVNDLVAREIRADRRAEADGAALSAVIRTAARERRAARRLARLRQRSSIAHSRAAGYHV